MAISDEITRLQQAKAALKTSIEGKGVTVSSSATLDDYPDLVDSIEAGGGSIEDLISKENLVRIIINIGSKDFTLDTSNNFTITSGAKISSYSIFKIKLVFADLELDYDILTPYPNVPQINVTYNYLVVGGITFSVLCNTTNYTDYYFTLYLNSEQIGYIKAIYDT